MRSDTSQHLGRTSAVGPRPAKALPPQWSKRVGVGRVAGTGPAAGSGSGGQTEPGPRGDTGSGVGLGSGPPGGPCTGGNHGSKKDRGRSVETVLAVVRVAPAGRTWKRSAIETAHPLPIGVLCVRHPFSCGLACGPFWARPCPKTVWQTRTPMCTLPVLWTW